MRLVPYNVKRIEKIAKSRSNELVKFLEEFIDCDVECVEVKDYQHKSASSCQASFSKAIRTNHFDNIKCIVRKKHVYLIRVDKVRDFI